MLSWTIRSKIQSNSHACMPSHRRSHGKWIYERFPFSKLIYAKISAIRMQRTIERGTAWMFVCKWKWDGMILLSISRFWNSLLLSMPKIALQKHTIFMCLENSPTKINFPFEHDTTTKKKLSKHWPPKVVVEKCAQIARVHCWIDVTWCMSNGRMPSTTKIGKRNMKRAML